MHKDSEDTRARYLAVADEIRSQIEGGVFGVGSVLPRHVELAEAHGVSKEAAADAVRLLEREGLVRAIRRRGTVVLPRGRRLLDLPAPWSGAHALDHEWGDVGLASRARPAEWPLRPEPPAEVAGIGDDAQVRTGLRLLGADGRVEQVLATWDARDEGEPALSWETVVASRLPTADEAKVLDAPARFPLLRVLRVGRADDGAVRSVAESLITAQRYEVRCPAFGHADEARSIVSAGASLEGRPEARSSGMLKDLPR